MFSVIAIAGDVGTLGQNGSVEGKGHITYREEQGLSLGPSFIKGAGRRKGGYGLKARQIPRNVLGILKEPLVHER